MGKWGSWQLGGSSSHPPGGGAELSRTKTRVKHSILSSFARPSGGGTETPNGLCVPAATFSISLLGNGGQHQLSCLATEAENEGPGNLREKMAKMQCDK